MLLPQSDAFTTLQRRLSAIPPHSIRPANSSMKNKQEPSESRRNKIDFDELFKYFINIQERHREQKHKQRQMMLKDIKESANADT